MSAAADIRGMKRICTECGTRFYDMNKRPIVCPSCKTEFTGEIKVKSRRGRGANEDTAGQITEAEAKKAAKDDDEDELEEDDDDTQIVSLDDVEEDSDDDEDEMSSDLDDDDLGDLDDDIGSLDDLEPDADLDEDDDERD